MTPVIIFGPTGQSGSVAARTAGDLGAKVWLAMRDTNKPIPGLSKAQEQAGNYHRVPADLQNPETVTQAVKTSGAKRAFIYLAHGSADHMKGTLSALKAAGIDFVVFLSSFTIPTNKPLRAIPASQYIPYVHAQVEANLDDIFGQENYVAVRCGAFITNLLEQKAGIIAGKVHMWGGNFEQDNITTGDIGRVMGNILVNGSKNGQKKVYLYGPEFRTRRDGIVKIGELLGKSVQVTALGPEEAYDQAIARGLPPPVAKYMIDVLKDGGPDKGDGERFPRYDEGVHNVELYTGQPAQGFEDWFSANKGLFDA